MTDSTEGLGTFEERDVLQVKVIVTKTGDGLSESMAIDPQILHLGDEGYVVLKFRAVKIRHESIKDTDALARIQILEAQTATLVDDDVVRDAIARQEEKNAEAREAAAIAKAGKHQGSLDIGPDEATKNLVGEHVLGFHADDLVEDCPRCIDEIDAIADEDEARLAAQAPETAEAEVESAPPVESAAAEDSVSAALRAVEDWERAEAGQ